MKWIAVTNKRKIEIEAKRRFDAERKAWKLVEKGEEVLYVIIKEQLILLSPNN